MGIKRKNPNGVSQQEYRKGKEYKEYMLGKKIFFLKHMNKFLDYNYYKLINPKITELYLGLGRINFRKKRIYKGLIYTLLSFFITPKYTIEMIKKYEHEQSIWDKIKRLNRILE